MAEIKYPDYVMAVLRQRRGLEPNDRSQDSLISMYEPIKALREMTGWELGDSSWADRILRWARDCGIEIKG